MFAPIDVCRVLTRYAVQQINHGLNDLDKDAHVAYIRVRAGTMIVGR